MDNNTVMKIAVCISAVTLVMSFASLVLTLTDDGPEEDVSYTMYFGMDPDSTESEMSELQTAVTGAVTSAGYGYTLHWAEGGYASEDGEVVGGQRTLVVTVAFADGVFIDSLVNDVKTDFGLGPVLVERMGGQVELV